MSMKMRKSLRKRLSLRKLGSFRRKKSDVDEQDYLEAFQNYDIDNSGSVDKMELYIVMKSLGYTLTEKQLLNMMNAVDTDSSGEISYKEFVDMLKRTELETDFEKEIREAFEFFDKDGNGVISPDELSEIMKGLGANLSDKEINLLVKEADANGDGEIDVGEFLALMYS